MQSIDVAADGTVWGLLKDGRTGVFRWTVNGWRGEWDIPKDTKEPMCGIACGSVVRVPRRLFCRDFRLTLFFSPFLARQDHIWGFNQMGIPFQFENSKWRCAPADKHRHLARVLSSGLSSPCLGWSRKRE